MAWAQLFQKQNVNIISQENSLYSNTLVLADHHRPKTKRRGEELR